LVANLPNFQRLQSLGLAFCNISSLGVAEVLKATPELPSLQSVDMSGNEFDAIYCLAALDALMKHHRELKVVSLLEMQMTFETRCRVMLVQRTAYERERLKKGVVLVSRAGASDAENRCFQSGSNCT
jgi:hypothetical protein